MISSISIQGFKSYKSLKDFPLRALNVFIGPNRSGKTNFLDFWDLLAQAGKQQLSNAINKRGGIGSVMSWDQSTSLSFELQLEARETFLQENGINYEAVIRRQQLSYSVSREHLAKRPQKKELQTSLLTTSASSALLYNHLTAKQEKQDGQLDSSELAITQIRDAVAYPTLDKLRRYLNNITVHRPFNTSDDAPIRNAQLVGVREPDIPPTRLARGGIILRTCFILCTTSQSIKIIMRNFWQPCSAAFLHLSNWFFLPMSGRVKPSWHVKTEICLDAP
jgi:predicted ATPase